MAYDSTKDTENHIVVVAEYLNRFTDELALRSALHDKSKLLSPEKQMFDEFTPKLKELEYGSDEYKQALVDMSFALKHHYENNSHHPEHYDNGIDGMNLFDLIEMLADWLAAIERHPDGDINKSLVINAKRFNMSEQLVNIFDNTIQYIKKG